jgi:hypothetical protein
MVIDDGRVSEIGSPAELLCNEPAKDTTITRDGPFATLVRNTGNENSRTILAAALSTHHLTKRKKIE